ncbi:acyl-CoA thioesterase [Rhizobium leguminosarum]|uniref:acyl-CoA thioesterase n=1 Tax=Rhizobium leguminosarum TaxID=384 RepID=UPI001AE40334|nr:acyl-CoA thioesterase [Rhizobium leguminosarum]MBP2449957.1 4-hydroxybenzoyl-CoA thioesterase [Rhizobium leguminosarum]
MPHESRIDVTFGDCDPAGIVFYPNIFRWLDKSFHDWLRTVGGHASICEKLGSIGLGLIEAQSQFRRPLTDGDVLIVSVAVRERGSKTLSLTYEGSVDHRLMFVAQETRGLFKRTGDAMVAAKIAPLGSL